MGAQLRSFSAAAFIMAYLALAQLACMQPKTPPRAALPSSARINSHAKLQSMRVAREQRLTAGKVAWPGATCPQPVADEALAGCELRDPTLSSPNTIIRLRNRNQDIHSAS